MNQQDRLMQLEIQLAHLQRTCEQLNEMVTAMSLDARKRDQLIDRMVAELKDFKVKGEKFASQEDERPPHY